MQVQKFRASKECLEKQERLAFSVEHYWQSLSKEICHFAREATARERIRLFLVNLWNCGEVLSKEQIQKVNLSQMLLDIYFFLIPYQEPCTDSIPSHKLWSLVIELLRYEAFEICYPFNAYVSKKSVDIWHSSAQGGANINLSVPLAPFQADSVSMGTSYSL